MNRSKYPLMTVGLPVFNGASHLQITIEAILGQSYQNIELLICDNASTDGTAKIAEQATLQDKRVKLIRNESNLGIFNNFNRVLQEATGEFFMWAAHDDSHSPGFIEECINNLVANPQAVMCQTRVAICLEQPEQVIYYSSLDSFVGKRSIESRYKETLFRFPAVAIYGVFRSNIAKRIPGFRNIPGGDLLWVQEMALMGEFIQSDRVLFHYIARNKWNSFEDDLKNLGTQSDLFKNPTVLAFAILWDRIKTICRSETSAISKTRLLYIAVDYSIKTISVRALLKVTNLLGSNGLIRFIKNKLYWRYLHNPNIEIVEENLFHNRIIKPTVGLL